MADEELFRLHNWYHGAISREEANTVLNNTNIGWFLVRRRKGLDNEYVLSVKEKRKISHYIVLHVNNIYYKIGEQRFADISSIIEFYKKHALDTTILEYPVSRHEQVSSHSEEVATKKKSLKVCAKFHFPGNDPEDLSFQKGDILEILHKEEEKWWLARDSTGREGMIPAPYVEAIKTATSPSVSPKVNHRQLIRSPQSSTKSTGKQSDENVEQAFTSTQSNSRFAVAIQNREPNFYDQTMLGFKKGETIEILQTHEDGSWEGKVVSTGKVGFFPFNYVKVLLDTKTSY